MSPDGTVRLDHVWKGFRADRGRKLLRDHVERLWARVNRRAETGWRWVLRDVSFAIEPGEAVGLVGVNGSGKSTLLKVVSGVMDPYAGSMEVTGRIGALIEVTSGIHPDLTGRENIVVYGSLLGWTRRDILARFDEIVAFAEIEDAVDRQVKFYSSGMKMRLGFSIAAFLEPAVLLVDEVLAVGDATFQQKCLERMRGVLDQGTTLVFVSHDLAAVAATCTRGLWLTDGRIAMDGPVADVLAAYRGRLEETAEATPRAEGEVRVGDVRAEGPDGGPVQTGEPCRLRFRLEGEKFRAVHLYLGVSEGDPSPVFVLHHEATVDAGGGEYQVTLPHLPLPAGTFYVWSAVYGAYGGEISPWQPCGRLVVSGPGLDPLPRALVRQAPFWVGASWERLG